MKNFDRNIEQMMNEHEVTPPFGMWNRISAELDKEVAQVPVSVNSPIPQRTIFGFIAGALLISASMMTAYLVNDYSKKEKAVIVNNVVVDKTINTTPVVSETPTIIFRENTKQIARYSKPISITKPVEERIVAQAKTPTTPVQILPTNTEVSVPAQFIAENSGGSEPYYFPAIDMNSPKTEATPITKAVKVDTKNPDDNDREISSNDFPKIKFRPKKHRSFSYGKIIRRK